MADSRTRPRKADPLELSLLDAVASTLQRAQARLEEGDARGAEPLKRRSPRRAGLVAVLGYSGGRDSTALLALMTKLAARRGSPLAEVIAVHVHHGLSQRADEWLAHCEREAKALGAQFVGRHVSVRRSGRGIEAAARDARYKALTEVAVEHGARVVCSAHHRDDRLETFLIQWLRGAGVEGLAAFPNAREFAPGELLLVRPFIEVARDEDRKSVV